MARLFVILGLATSVWAAGATPAGAHPLGNFTTNRYARVEVGATVVRIHYVLDEAELVAFRNREELAGMGRERYGAQRVEEIRSNLRLDLDGRPAPLVAVAHRLTQPPGQGGLSTLRIDALFEARLPERPGEIELLFRDGNQPDRLGWREVVAATAAGARLRDADSSPAELEEDRTGGLRRYPTDPGVAPLDVRDIRFSFIAGDGRDARGSLDSNPSASTAAGGERFVRLLDDTASSPLSIAFALVIALGFGAVHALGPGHGKTVMAAYLVSTSGRRRDALALGLVVSLMHTASVLVLAGLLATVGREFNAARVYPWLTVVAGVLVVGVGGRLLVRRMRGARGSGSHAHVDHDHSHDHEHSHDHSQSHDHSHGAQHTATPELALVGAGAGGTSGGSHAEHRHGLELSVVPGHHHGPSTHTHELAEDVKPLSRAGLVALGTSGGLFPSPSAVVLLVGAFALGRTGLGLALIAAFSTGLAAVLVGVGLLLVAGRERIQSSNFAVHLPWLPVAGATAIVALGTVLLVQGVAQLR